MSATYIVRFTLCGLNALLAMGDIILYKGNMDKGKIDRGFAEAGWEPDGTFSEHLSIGNSGDLCILAHWSTWKTDDPTYELYDVGRHLSYWVHEVPTPEQAAALLEEHGESPEEE